MNKRRRCGYSFFLLALAVMLMAATFSVGVMAEQDEQKTVVIIPLEGEVTPALADFLKDKLTAANQAGADAILLTISTLGGQVAAAIDMRDAILASDAPVAIYIGDRAISACALITIAADTIIMAPGSHFGAAEPIPKDAKSVAYVSGEFRTTAELRGRDPRIAMAMVDASIAIEGLVAEGAILDMTAGEALQCGYADYIAQGRQEALKAIGMDQAAVAEEVFDFRYQAAQFLTSYEVAAILMILGMIGLVAELFIPGFGVPGIISIICFILYFAGGYLAGYTEWWSIILFVAGFILLALEFAAPGFSVFGIAGLLAIFTGVIFAAPNPGQGISIMAISFAAAVLAVPILIRIFGTSPLLRRLVLTTAATESAGYIHAERMDALLGKTGTTQTVLRPAGSAFIDGKRIDVLAEGAYIERNIPVKVIRVEGTKVIVAPLV